MNCQRQHISGNVLTMANATGMKKTAGNAGSLFALVGVLMFFLGIFGAPRMLAFAGLGLMIAAVVAFSVEEYAGRR